MPIDYTDISFPSVDSFINEQRPKVEKAIKQLSLSEEYISEPPRCSNLTSLIMRLEQLDNGERVVFSTGDIEHLIYHCGELDKGPIKLLAALLLTRIVPERWSRRFIRPLFSATLQNWRNSSIRGWAVSLLLNHTDEMTDAQQKALKYCDNPQSPYVLGRLLLNNSQSVLSATECLHVAPALFRFCYFIDVMIGYFKQANVSDELLEEMERALDCHNDFRANRVIVSCVVVNAANQTNLPKHIKERLIAICCNRIGEPTDQNRWSGNDLEENEHTLLQKCRNIIHRWMTAKVVDRAFHNFRTTDEDEERKLQQRRIYWCRFLDRLADMCNVDEPYVFIYSTASFAETIGTSYGRSIFKHLTLGTANTALVMRFNNYTVVELMRGGYVYFYKQGAHQLAEQAWRPRSIYSIGDLMDPELPEASSRQLYGNISGLPSNIKVRHPQPWWERLDRFIFNRALVRYDVNKDSIYRNEIILYS